MTYTAGAQDGQNATVWSTFTVFGARVRALGANAGSASVAWGTASDAFAFPFLVSTPVTFVGAFLQAGTTPGTTNFDLGIYNDAFARLISTGATASVNTTDAILPVGGATFTTSITLTRGRYFMAVSSAASTLTARAIAPANQPLRALGVYKMAAAYPLPATFVPASLGTQTFLPVMGLTTVAGAVL